MKARKIVYEFEHAESLDELQPKIDARVRNGWKISGAPREVPVQTAEFNFSLRYCQTFYRYSEESITREPWIVTGR
jgi:hypothetical protein